MERDSFDTGKRNHMQRHTSDGMAMHVGAERGALAVVRKRQRVLPASESPLQLVLPAFDAALPAAVRIVLGTDLRPAPYCSVEMQRSLKRQKEDGDRGPPSLCASPVGPIQFDYCTDSHVVHVPIRTTILPSVCSAMSQANRVSAGWHAPHELPKRRDSHNSDIHTTTNREICAVQALLELKCGTRELVHTVSAETSIGR
jgi:hypothetical protein